MPDPTRILLAEAARKRGIAAARQDLAQARSGKLPSIDIDGIATRAGYQRQHPGQLWTRADMVGLIQHLAAAPKAAAPATTRPAAVKPLVAPSRTTAWDQLAALPPGPERTKFYRTHRRELDRERNANR